MEETRKRNIRDSPQKTTKTVCVPVGFLQAGRNVYPQTHAQLAINLNREPPQKRLVDINPNLNDAHDYQDNHLRSRKTSCKPSRTSHISPSGSSSSSTPCTRKPVRRGKGFCFSEGTVDGCDIRSHHEVKP